MNAILQCDAPGLRGPADQPEYTGPSIDELVAQKMRDPEFLCAATGLIPKNTYAPLAENPPDLLTFGYRFRFEAIRVAYDEARAEYEAARKAFADQECA